MTETEKDDFPSDLVPRTGIVCPWNKRDDGPAGMRIQCVVYKNWDTFLEWGSDDQHDFCRRLCEYGRNPQYARRADEIKLRQRGGIPGWQKQLPTTDPIRYHPSVKVKPPRDFQFPVRGRKVE